MGAGSLSKPAASYCASETARRVAFAGPVGGLDAENWAFATAAKATAAAVKVSMLGGNLT